MLGLGIGEILLIGAVGVLFFGPKKLPELGTAVGKAITNFKKGLQDASNENDNHNNKDTPVEKITSTPPLPQIEKDPTKNPENHI
jgi:sec-independent protein translocase protein TatA